MSPRYDPAAQEAALAAQAFCAAFFAELARSGVEHVCVSPGSRSTPLTVAAHREDGLRCWPIVDERSAAFFALGLARQSGAPVALICTSGTAAANYLPAVVEAHHARVPLLVLTADRPPELRDWGAGQTIDQLGLYGSRVRRFVELPVPGPGAAMLRYARALACRSVADAQGEPAGPVHLNWPLREPLEPVVSPDAARENESEVGVEPRLQTLASKLAQEPGPHAGQGRHDAAGDPDPAHALVSRAAGRATQEQLGVLVDRVREHERGVIACGPLPPVPGLAEAISTLGRAAGWPILADPTSQLRRGAHVGDAPVIAHADLLLRDERFGHDSRPTLLLRFGDSPVSKAQRLWLRDHPPAHWLLVDPGEGWSDPDHLASEVLRFDPLMLCRDLVERLGEPRPSGWASHWQAADARVAGALASAIVDEPALLEPRAVHELAELLPEESTLFVSNSMPVRDLDAFLPASPRPLRVLCNRGASGIDGVVSSALGAAAADRGPVVLLIGDLALLHDLGGLLAARVHGLSLSIVVLNNDGGGIFSFLPIAEHGESVGFEALFRTPHGVDLSHVAALIGASYSQPLSWSEYRDALLAATSRPPGQAGVHLIELRVDRDANVKHFRELVAVASGAIGAGAAS